MGNNNVMANQPVQNNPSGNNKKMILIIAAILVIAVVSIVLVLVLNKDNSTSNGNSNSQNSSSNTTPVKQEKKDTFQANIYLLTKEENGRYSPIFNNYKPVFKINGEEVKGSIEFADGKEMLMPGEEAFVTIKLDSSVMIQEGMNFEMYEANRKVGTGVISKEASVTPNTNTNSNSNSNSTNKEKVTIGQVNPNTNLSYDENGAFLMYVEDVFTITGKGTVVTGKISRGTIKVGDEFQVLGLDGEILTAQIAGIDMSNKEAQFAKIGDNVGLILKDVQRDQIQRGEAIVAPNTMIATTDFEADIHVASKSEGGKDISISSGYQAKFAIGGVTTYEGTVSTSASIQPGKDGKISVRLNSPVAMEVGMELNIREGGTTVATGKITKVN